MKTITLQGTDSQFKNLDTLQFSYGDSDRLPKVVETRVYVIEAYQSLRYNEKVYTHLTDEEFMTIAEENGTAYSIQFFQDTYNEGKINSDYQVIRFINVPLN